MTRWIWNKTYPILLRTAGYRTAFAGKYGLLVENPDGGKAAMPEEDFDMWGGGAGQSSYDAIQNKPMAKYAKDYPHSTLSYAAFSKDFIAESAEAKKPFCLSISFKASHRPVQPDPQFDHIYVGKKFTVPANYGRDNGAHFAKQATTGRQYTRFEEWGYSGKYDEVMAKYHQQIYGIDVAVGRIREALEKHGVADNTIVIFTSDNGFFCGSHGYGSKVLPHEEASRVPLIVFDPRHKNSGKKIRHETLTDNIDFAPTTLELVGLDIPANMDGKSLLPLYDDSNATAHESLPLINVWGPIECQSLSIVTVDFKHIHWSQAGDGFEATQEFYHLSKDPNELTNAAANPEYQAPLEKMRATYDAEVTKWKAQAVTHNGYSKYGTFFDRNADWTAKEAALEVPKADKKPKKQGNKKDKQA